MPSLAVVVPTLDEIDRLPALLDDLLAREEADRPDEVLVVDGGSRDGTAQAARAHGVRVLEVGRGRGRQLAAGARATEADLLLFLHADAGLSAGALASVRRAFGAADLVAAGLHQRIDHGRRVYRWIEWCADRKARAGWVYGDSGLAVRRSVYQEVGGFRDLPVFEDLDLSRRLRRRGRVDLVEGARITVSPRRWEADGPVRRTLKNWCLTAAFAAGVDPRRLARYYPPPAPGDLS